MESKSGITFKYQPYYNFCDLSNKWLKSIYNEKGEVKTVDELKESD